MHSQGYQPFYTIVWIKIISSTFELVNRKVYMKQCTAFIFKRKKLKEEEEEKLELKQTILIDIFPIPNDFFSLIWPRSFLVNFWKTRTRNNHLLHPNHCYVETISPYDTFLLCFFFRLFLLTFNLEWFCEKWKRSS